MNKFDELSKEISYALRHAPWEYELEMDEEGWVPIQQIIDSLQKQEKWEDICIEDLKMMIQKSEKRRHEIIGENIRAFYAHSLPMKILKEEKMPPNVLYHGTARRYIKSIIENGVDIGPYARLRTNCHILEDVHMGNFVEMKKAVFGKGSKAAHLSYIGDATVGSDVNIGCGTITVNYDGKNKSQTIIEDNAFIGCNSNLVAPVTVKKNAFIAAGSTITEEVEEDAMAIARAKQVNKLGYTKILERKRNQKGK